MIIYSDRHLMQCLAKNRSSQSTREMTYPAESPLDESPKPQLLPYRSTGQLRDLRQHWTAKGPQTGHSAFSAFHGPIKALTSSMLEGKNRSWQWKEMESNNSIGCFPSAGSGGTPAIPAIRGLSQEDPEAQCNLGNRARFCQRERTKSSWHVASRNTK